MIFLFCREILRLRILLWNKYYFQYKRLYIHTQSKRTCKKQPMNKFRILFLILVAAITGYSMEINRLSRDLLTIQVEPYFSTQFNAQNYSADAEFASWTINASYPGLSLLTGHYTLESKQTGLIGIFIWIIILSISVHCSATDF
jgi:hypothetical protein